MGETAQYDGYTSNNSDRCSITVRLDVRELCPVLRHFTQTQAAGFHFKTFAPTDHLTYSRIFLVNY